MLSDTYFAQIIADMCCVAEHFIRHNFKKCMESNFHSQLCSYMVDVFSAQQKYMDIDPDLFLEYIDYTINEYIYKFVIPARHYTIFSFGLIRDHNSLHQKMKSLMNVVQPAQRSPEWFIQRSNLITASNAYKAITSQANINAIILEKIKAYKALTVPVINTRGYAGAETPFQYGIRNEPVSTMYFEHVYNTKVGEFGCMIHKDYPFLGASPDGIVIDSSTNMYGTMLEIKNPTSRVITGTPIKEYWVQMQLQMEVCDLDNCLFLETHMFEYETYEEFINDGSFQYSSEGHFKGVINEFKGECGPHYEYLPFNATQEDYDAWKPDTNLDFVRNWYWKMDKVSCVLVKRNREWFASVIPQFCTVWQSILTERETDDYSHRLPRQRVNKIETPVIVQKNIPFDLQ